jgi:hypothetical protein
MLTPKQLKTIQNGQTVELLSGSVFSNIQRLSMAGSMFQGILVRKSDGNSPQDDRVVGRQYAFNGKQIKLV